MSKSRYFLAVMACIFLFSCKATDRLKFWDKGGNGNYMISGVESDEQTYEYIKSVVKEGFSQEIENAEDLKYLREKVRLDVLKALHAKGYYDAKVAYIDKTDGNTDGRYDISLGKIVTISSVSITPAKYKDKLKGLDIKIGDPLEAAKVLSAQRALYNGVQKQSCAFDLDVSHSVILDPDNHNAQVEFEIEQGVDAVFGTLEFKGASSVDLEYLKKLISWEEGSCFKHSKLSSIRDKLLGSGLFSRVEAVLPENAKDLNKIPVVFELKERAPRTVRAGLSYYTDKGIGAVFGWEHRNFFGSGEKLKADLTLSTLEQSLKAKLTKPYFLRDDQNLSVHSFIKRKDTDAFESLSMGGGFSVKRKFGRYLSATAGSDIEITRISEDDKPSDNFGLISPLASLIYDSRNDKLDPNSGYLFRLSSKPSIDAFGKSDPFVKNKLTAQAYREAGKKVVLAGRVNIGSITGSGAQNLPASERFYAGGGGSIRGFGYQEVGPYENGDPAGGRSLFESSFEIRFKATKTLGGVAFVDVGQVYDEIIPSFNNLAIGAGLGARYYTDFGPLRFDVGVPLQGNDNSDANFQIYISIGQSF